MLSGKDYNLVIKEILDFAQNLCKADGCFLYSVNTEDFMSLEFSRINTVGLNKIGSDNLTLYPSVFVPDLKNKKCPQHLLRTRWLFPGTKKKPNGLDGQIKHKNNAGKRD